MSRSYVWLLAPCLGAITVTAPGVALGAVALAAPGAAAALRVTAPTAATDTAWTSVGTLVCTALGARNAPTVVPDGSGGTLIVWEDSRDGTARDLYAMRLDPDGNRVAGWPAEGAPVCVANSDQVDPVVAGDGAGGVLIAWQDARGLDRDIYAQHLDGSGTPVTGWPANGLALCSAAGDQIAPAMIGDQSGGAIVAWVDRRSGTDAIYALRVDADGTLAPGWGNDGLAVCTASGSKLDPAIASDDSGGAIVAWVDRRSGDANLYAARVTTVGERPPSWPPDGLVLTGALLDQDQPAIVEDGKRGAFVAWRDGRFGEDDLYAQHVLGNGLVASGWPADGLILCDEPGSQSQPRLVRDGGSGAIVCWEDQRNGNDDVYATRVTKDGAIDPNWPATGKAVCSLAGNQSGAVLTPNGAGGALIAWLDQRAVQPGFYAQNMTGLGEPLFGWPAQGAPLMLAGVGLTPPAIASDSSGGAVLAWSDRRSADENVYALRFRGDATVPAEVSLVDALAEPGRVFVRWSLAASLTGSVRVERRAEGGDWATQALLAPDHSGLVAHEDRDVVDGARYGYRLIVPLGGREQALGETWVEVPRASRLALEGFRPNPAPRSPAIAFTIVDGSPASIEVADVAGRRVLSRPVGSLGPGRHTLGARELASLPPGIYLVTLRQSGRALTVRGCVIH